VIVRPAELLAPADVERVHEASLEILAEVGLLVRNERARALLARHGCPVDGATQVVRFPRGVVETYRQGIPPRFTFRGRDPRFDRTVPDDAPVVISGSSAPDLVDPATGETRRARSDDIARIAHLVQHLPGIDVFSISTLADDAAPGHHSVARLHPALRYCQKPIRLSGPPEDTERIWRFGVTLAGSEAAYRERPFITHHYCPVVSPLTMDFDSTEALMHWTAEGLPGHPTVVPNAGLTAPLTLLGTLVQGNAEFLAAAVLEQMVRPGKPTLYSALPTVADMRTGAYAPGAIETGILFVGVAQLARFYGVPCGGYIGLSNAKVNDAQSGFETGMSAVAGLLGGVHIFNMAGLLDALMSFDFAKAVVDDEIVAMLRRLRQGLPAGREEAALDVLRAVGPGGMFADHPHTLGRMRAAAFLPEIADRHPRQAWQERGALDAQARAMRRVRDILTRDAPGFFSPEVDARLRAEFPDLGPGLMVPPAGWTREAAPLSARERRRRRAEGAGVPPGEAGA
jgi:trimethylamine--corrinoid protein Co-methyltransferase